MNIFDTEWNIAYNVGVKCNALDVTKTAGVRYFSSPWDNMDTVRGLTQTAELMASGFENYMADINDWTIWDISRQRQLRHKDYIWCYYPHMDFQWVKNYTTEEDYNKWKRSKEGDLNPIWKGFAETYTKRQQRMTSILESENKMLLLRIDVDNRQLRKIRNQNKTKHLNRFMETMTKAYPTKNWGFLYLYCDENRNLSCDYDNCHLECIPPGKSGYRSKWVVDKLKELKVLPRDEMKPYDFAEEGVG
jgi:hypothetical protein